jgi:hypothetical protein
MLANFEFEPVTQPGYASPIQYFVSGELTDHPNDFGTAVLGAA